MSRLDRERKVAGLLPGWVCTRAAKGAIDVVAVRRISSVSSEVRFIQVKSTAQSPWERFGPDDRAKLLALAEQAGASAWLLYWPIRSKPTWIPSDRWP